MEEFMVVSWTRVASSLAKNESGPFKTREQAERFATGLAQSGKCDSAEIVARKVKP